MRRPRFTSLLLVLTPPLAALACARATEPASRGPLSATPPVVGAQSAGSSAVAVDEPVGSASSDAVVLAPAPTLEPLAPAQDFVWDGKALVPRSEAEEAAREAARKEAPGTTGAVAGESFGVGGLGLSGVGEGGGGTGLGSVGTVGRGAGVGTGAGFGAGHGRLGGSHAVSGGAPLAPQLSGVKAGEWDDNANLRDFRVYLKTQTHVGFAPIDLRSRRFLVVKDDAGKPVPNCAVTVRGAGRSVTLRTQSSGRALLFPYAEGLGVPRLTATAECAGSKVSAQFSGTAEVDDAAVTLTLDHPRQLPEARTVDVVFVLDTTGSMSEEIDAMKKTVEQVASTLGARQLTVRFGLVEYKDHGDEYVTRLHPMTRDVAGFVQRVSAVRASGGGDTPEDVNEGLRVALSRMAWSSDSVARLAFLIGDAPPHLDYQGSYLDGARSANRAGTQVFTVAASGMDAAGQAVWRQVAQYTGGTNLFVLRGGAGPQSVGAGDAASGCGGTHKNFSSGNLHELVTLKVEQAIAALDADPLRIAGLGRDERAKPCNEQIAAQ